MPNVSFLKRALVIIYDGLLMFGVTLVGYVLVYAMFAILPDQIEASIFGKTLKVAYLLGVSLLFYGWFWTHGGQTLGMKVWNLFVVNAEDGKFISWQRATIRYLAALISWGLMPAALWFAGVERWYLAIGIGFTWMLVNKQNLAWHDILSNTRMVQMPKGKPGKLKEK